MTWKRFGAGGSSARMAVPMLPPICTSRPERAQDVGDQRRGGRLAVGAGDGDERRVGARPGTLAAEQLDVADDLDAGGLGFGHRPVRLGMRERHAGRQHEGRKSAPIGGGDILDRKAGRRRRAASRGAVVGGDHRRPAGGQRAARGDARNAETEHGDSAARECGDRSHRRSLVQVSGIDAWPSGEPLRLIATAPLPSGERTRGHDLRARASRATRHTASMARPEVIRPSW